MFKIWLIGGPELPPPQSGFDLAIWPTTGAPSETKLRTWAGWSETYLLAGDVGAGAAFGFTSAPSIWPAADLAVGRGKVWRIRHHYIAWLDASDLEIPEIPRALGLAGVELVIGPAQQYPSAFADPLWRAVQSSQLYGLGWGAQPQLYLPCELDADEDGAVPLESTLGGYGLALDFDRLAEARRLFPVAQGLRPALYKALPWWVR